MAIMVVFSRIDTSCSLRFLLRSRSRLRSFSTRSTGLDTGSCLVGGDGLDCL